MIRDAIFSKCKTYRYELHRIWDAEGPKIMFLMLNPSTANETIDDRTVSRCINYAQEWGYGGLLIGNLFSYRSRYPEKLFCPDDPIGPLNNFHLKEMSKRCERVICAWGNSSLIKKLNFDISKLNDIKAPLFYLEKMKDGTPKHPLYLRKSLLPRPFSIK